MDKVKVIQIDTKPAQNSAKELQKELKELRGTLVSAEKGSQEYTEALSRAAEIQHQLADTNKEIRNSAMDFGQVMGNVTKTLGGLSAGFQAAQATMNLFGVENEDIIKSMQKMQSLMAMTQALPALDEARKAMGRLRDSIALATKTTSAWGKALIGTGIGAIVVGLGLLISHFDEISDWLDNLTGKTDTIGDVTDRVVSGLKAAWSGLVQTFIALGTAIKNYVMTPFESVMAAVEAYTSTEGSFAEKIKAASKAIANTFTDNFNETVGEFKEIGTKAAETYANAYDEASTKRANERLEKQRKQEEEEAKKRAEAVSKAQKEAQERVNKQLADIERERNKELLELNKEGITNEEEYNRRKNEINQKYNDLRINQLEKSIKEEVNLSKDAVDNYTKDLIKLTDANQQFIKDTQPDISGIFKEATKKYTEDNLRLLNEDFTNYDNYIKQKKELDARYLQEKIDAIQNVLDTETNLTEEQIQKLKEQLVSLQSQQVTKPTETEKKSDAQLIAEGINQAAMALNDFSGNAAWGNVLKNISLIAANWDDTVKNIQEGGEKAATSILQLTSAGLSAMGELFNGLADAQDDTTKEGFEKQKNLQVAGATMSMLAGIVQTWASAMQLGPIAGPIMGALLSAMMLTTGIMNIQKIKSQQFDSKASATPSTSAVNVLTPPTQYTQDVQGASIESSIRDTKVYVTETDISKVQNKVRVTENEARF